MAQTRPPRISLPLILRMTNLNKTLIDVPITEDQQIKTPEKNENVGDATIFPCTKCDRIFPKKLGRALHLSKTHNIKTINYTPGIVRQNSKKHMGNTLVYGPGFSH